MPLTSLAFALLLAAPPQSAAEVPALRLEPLASGVSESLRGLSVVDDRIAWASGTNGHVGRSLDGGRSWSWTRIPGFETRDLRDVEAFSAERALVLVVGSPGAILETGDGGRSWVERFRDERVEVFLDGLECLDDGRCFAFGDPIGNRFLFVASADGGRTWRELEAPEAIPGEAGFAASGRSIRSDAGGTLAIGTGGGEAARLLLSDDAGKSWRAEPTPLRAGAPSRGVFALAPRARELGGGWAAVGGDYLEPEERSGTAGFRSASEPMLVVAETLPGGYRSAVEPLGGGRLLATGPNGTDLSEDGGRTWHVLSKEGFHVAARARKGTLVLLAGADGRMARLEGQD